MPRSRVLLAFVGLCMFALGGCKASNDSTPIDSMTIYSLDGEYMPGESKPWPGETFKRYPVLGKTEVASPEERSAILAAIKKGIAEANDRTTITCFWPHHGVSLMRGGRRIEYLICFHCRQTDIWGDGEYRHANTTAAAANLLDARLQAAKVPQKTF